MSYLFYGKESFNEDIASWDVSSVTDMEMFYGTSSLSDENKCLIHTAWSYNEYWEYDWSDLCIYGCIDELACNYNPDANSDDGSCFYYDPEIACDCDGTLFDVNGDCCSELLMDTCNVCNGDGWSCSPLGDVNQDYSVDIADIVIIIQHFLEYDILTGNAYNNADWDGNGNVNIIDIVNIVQIIDYILNQ